MSTSSSALFEQYTEACSTPSDIVEHLPFFVTLCQELRATKVIELGTRGGVSTVAWLYGVELTDGHLWSVDIHPAPEHTNAWRRWTFLQGDDLDPDVYSQLPELADVVFIDTSHLYEHTLAELNTYRGRVRPGGRIVLHDTELAQPLFGPPLPRFPVKTAVEEFCEREHLTWQNYPNCFGLGVVTIPE